MLLRDGSTRPSALAAAVSLAAALAILSYSTPTPAQSPVVPDARACAAEARLPVVPMLPPRPPEGPNPGQQWTLGPRDVPPTAAFLDAVKGNDALIEIILGQGRLLTVKADIAGRPGTGVVALGDPSIVDFEVLPNPRMLRLIGKRPGVTDLSITTADGQTYGFEIHVVYDLQLLRAQLREAFPDAEVRLGQIREHLIVEGESHSPAQVAQIMRTLEAYVESAQVPPTSAGRASAGPAARPYGTPTAPPAPSATKPAVAFQPEPYVEPVAPGVAAVAPGGLPSTSGVGFRPQIVNLMRVVGLHQVLLQVRVAELNRTAMRQIGADMAWVDPARGNIVGTSLVGSPITFSNTGSAGSGPTLTTPIPSATTAFAILPTSNFEILFRALRQNSVATILAEPNLVAMDGQQASFLAGGQFPVPVAQTGTGASGTAPITVQWKDFGVLLNFVPYVIDDRSIRLHVMPEVSSIDEALGTSVAGTTVPGVDVRRADTTVELQEGQTLAIAGLLQVTIDGTTARIPVLGDLAIIGPFFSNTTHKRVEKELVVLITPHLVTAMDPCQVPPSPGCDVQDPTDFEFYLKNRIEGCSGTNYRSTTGWDDPKECVRVMRIERSCVSGPVGYSR